ncbi:MAG: DUF3413 domain-containing protein [Planctomycetes bacterium]|nr:DUF3413 domain-containing protein [Planctomycetota bacterium]
MILIFNFQFFTYGISHLEANTPVLSASGALPLYIPVTFKRWAKKFGVAPKRTTQLKLDKKNSQLHYPLHPMQYDWTESNYNIVWLVAESWRADIGIAFVISIITTKRSFRCNRTTSLSRQLRTKQTVKLQTKQCSFGRRKMILRL